MRAVKVVLFGMAILLTLLGALCALEGPVSDPTAPPIAGLAYFCWLLALVLAALAGVGPSS